MSATLSWHLGPTVARAITRAAYPALDLDGPGVWVAALADLCMKESRYWAGASQGGYRPSVRLSLRLPRRSDVAWKLMGAAARAASKPVPVSAGPRILAGKLAASLGLPFLEGLFTESHPEAAFLDALAAAPGDLGQWGIYADWLEEHGPLSVGGEADARRRAELIRGWLGKKGLPRNASGVPLLAAEAARRFSGILEKWCCIPGVDGV